MFKLSRLGSLVSLVAILVIGSVGYLLLNNSRAAVNVDFNNDGKVDIFDLSILLTNYGQANRTFAQGDTDGNHGVDINDLNALLNNYGPPITQTGQSNWYAVNPTYLTDAQAAAKVVHMPELRSSNATANSYVPTAAELSSFYNALGSNGIKTTVANPLYLKVTGTPGLTNPSTDDLIQWTAWKWGIPEDVIRAVMVEESKLANNSANWNQSQLGQRITVNSTWYNLYPSTARITLTTDVYQSMGIMQIMWRPDGSRNPGTDPTPGTNSLRYESTAFNLDYWAATIRYFYDGLCPASSTTAMSCSPGYTSGQQWQSINAWYNPVPWNSANNSYVTDIQTILGSKPWTKAGF